MHNFPPNRLVVALAFVSGFARVAGAAEPKPITTQITAVTVYSDRAQVTRSGAVELPNEASRLVVGKLPGWIDAESVRVALDPPTAGQVIDVTVETAHLAEASEATVRAAQNAVRDVSDDLAAIQDDERTLQEEIDRLVAMRAMSLDKVPRELAVGEVKLKTLGETMVYITDTIRADRRQLRAFAKKRRDLEPVLAQRQRELSELQSRAQLQQSNVIVECKGTGRAQLRVTYLTPGAAWEPVGELRVTRGGSLVTVQQYASVTQTTGEDWSTAKLSFSTQNANDMLDVPRARGLVLDKGGGGLGNVVGHESFSRAQAIYAESNEVVARNKRDWGSSLQRQSEVQSRAAERFTQIAKRGTTAHFTALSDRAVRADGKPVRVPIASGDFAAKTKIVVVPEATLNAVRVAELTNGGNQPILPGRAALFDEGSFLGRSDLGFVAPGESFSVFLGVYDRLKVERTIDRKSSALRRKGKRTEMSLDFVVTAENLGATPITLELSERVPVAQTEEIVVSDIELPNKLKPDNQGVVKWTETIPPRSKQTWHIRYRLDYPSDFVARSRSSDSPSPAPPGAPRMKMHEQIDMMERAL